MRREGGREGGEREEGVREGGVRKEGGREGGGREEGREGGREGGQCYIFQRPDSLSEEIATMTTS